MSHKIKVIVCLLLVLALVSAQISDFKASAEPVTIGIMSFAGLVIALLGAYGISMTATHASRPKVAQMTLQLWQDWQTETASPVDSGLGNQLELVRDSQNNQYVKVSSAFTQKFKSFAAWLVQTHAELLAGEASTIWSQPGTGNVSLAGIGDFPVVTNLRYSDFFDHEWHEGDVLSFSDCNLLPLFGGTGQMDLPTGAFLKWNGTGLRNDPAIKCYTPDRYSFYDVREAGYQSNGLAQNAGILGVYLVHGFDWTGAKLRNTGASDNPPDYFALSEYQLRIVPDTGPSNPATYANWGFAVISLRKYTPNGGLSGSSTYSTVPYYYYNINFFNLDTTYGYYRGGQYASNTEKFFDLLFGDAPVDVTLPSSIVAVPDGAVDVPTWDIPADRDIYVGADFIYPGISLDVALESAVDASVSGTLADTNLRSLDSVETEALEQDAGYESIETSSPDSDSLQPVFGLDMVFPFCIPFDVAYFVERLQAARAAPAFDWPIVVPSLGIEETIHVDLSGWETVAGILRTLELIVFIIGLAYATRSMFIRG